MRLAGRTSLIVGGATGIGRAIAVQFAREGGQVAIADVNDDDGNATAARAEGIYLHCDARNAAAIERATHQVIARFGGLDVLVYAAADTGLQFAAADVSVSEWRESLALTLDGALCAAQQVIPTMIARGGGSIIFIASVEGMIGARHHAAYVTAKSALFGLTRSLAIDYGSHNIRVNTISPGIIDSGRPDIEAGKHDRVRMRFWRGMTVLGRLGQPSEIASVAAFLASDEASYLTGQNIAVDGGWTIGYPLPN